MKWKDGFGEKIEINDWLIASPLLKIVKVIDITPKELIVNIFDGDNESRQPYLHPEKVSITEYKYFVKMNPWMTQEEIDETA